MNKLFPLYRFGGGGQGNEKYFTISEEKFLLPIISPHPPKYLGADYCTIDVYTIDLSTL